MDLIDTPHPNAKKVLIEHNYEIATYIKKDSENIKGVAKDLIQIDVLLSFLPFAWVNGYLIQLDLSDLAEKIRTIQRCEVNFFCRDFFWLAEGDLSRVFSRGNPVPCYPNMHFPQEIERIKIVAVDTVFANEKITQLKN